MIRLRTGRGTVRVRRDESRTRGGRRDAIDVARILALTLVVVGHLTMAVIDRDRHGAVRGTNLLMLYPRWSVLAIAAPMPVFFAAGGWANATTSPRRAANRLLTLVGMAIAVVGCWSAAVLIASLLREGDPGVIGSGARLATQPLWFLAAYLPFAFWGRALSRAATVRPGWTIGGCLVLAGVLDVAHFGFGGPQWPSWLAFYLVWATPWLVGAWWRDRWTRDTITEWHVGIVLFAAAAFVAWLLISRAGYQASLIDYGSDGRSNTNPPTLYTAVVGLAQVGLLMILARPLDCLGARYRAFWKRAGTTAMAVYVWHLTALAICAAVVSIPAIPTPTRLRAAWWWSRPLWYFAVLASCAVLVGGTASARSRFRTRTQTSTTPPHIARNALGIVLATAGGGLVGLYGPTSVLRALACLVPLVAGWTLLRPASR